MRFAMRYTYRKFIWENFHFYLNGRPNRSIVPFRPMGGIRRNGTERFEPFLFLRTERNNAEKGGTGNHCARASKISQ